MTAPAATVLRGQDQPTVTIPALRAVPAFYVSDWVATGRLSGEAHLVAAPPAPVDADVIRSVLADGRLTDVEKMARISPRVLFGCEAAEEAVRHLTMAATVGVTATVDVEEHMQVSGWGGVPGECGAECACGVTYDNFDTIAEASELLDEHIVKANAEAARLRDGESTMSEAEHRAWWKGYAAGREDGQPQPGPAVTLRRVLWDAACRMAGDVKSWFVLRRAQKVFERRLDGHLTDLYQRVRDGGDEQ